MEKGKRINVGILIAHASSKRDLESDLYGHHIQKSLAGNENFTLLTVRKCWTPDSLEQIKTCLEDWTKMKCLDLIFIIGCSSISFITSKEVTYTPEGVSLSGSLSCLQSGIISKNLISVSWGFMDQSLILKLPKDLHYFEALLEKMAPTIVSVLKDAKNKNRSSVSFDAVQDNFWNQDFKSKSVCGRISERPRKSPYEMISVSKSLEILLHESVPLSTIRQNTKDCFSFVLAEDVVASEPYPPFPASIKDGYAVLASDRAKFRNVLAGVTTGIKPELAVKPGFCIRVSTGSMIPCGADAVIQVEDTVVTEKDEQGNEIKIEILKQPQKYQDIRAIGSDIAAGELLIASNTKISAAEMGILSVYGIQEVLTCRKPWVALLSTGDEISDPDDPLKPGCIRDSNKNSLKYALKENRIPVIDVGIARDIADDVKFHLVLAFETSDIIISTGGVSMGEKDILKQVLEVDFNAKIHFGRIHMKPGKPTTFSTLNYKGKKKLVFSLPGNPVSAFVCFYLFVIPCIKKLMGFNQPEHSIIKVKLGHDHKLDERPEFCRVTLKCAPDGVFVATTTGGQQSSRLSSMQNADALLMLPPKSAELQMLKAGVLVDAILLKSV